MSLYALENLDEAMEETKDLLLPFDLMAWTKIAIIALLASGVSLPNLPTMGAPGGEGDQVYTPDTDFENTPDVSAGPGDIPVTGMATGTVTDTVAVAVLAFAVILAGFFMYISSVFQFIFYRTVLDKKPVIVENVRKNAYRGLRYFGFQIGILILALAGLLVPAALMSVGNLVALAAVIVFWIPYVIVLSVLMSLVHDIALLRMMEEKEGLIEAWRNVWPEIKKQWRQVLAFLFVKFFINAAIGVALLMITLAIIIGLIIPFGILGILAGVVHPVLAFLVLVAGIITFTVIIIYVRMPFSVYVYTYIIQFYHDLTS